MRIKYLGTAAYEGVPSLFCECKNCKLARIKGGRNIRTRCQSLINNDLLIDFGPDTLNHFLCYSLDMNNIDTCLITHAHSDHLYPEDIVMASRPFSNNHHLLKIYSTLKSFNIIQSYLKDCDIKGLVSNNLINTYDHFFVGKNDKYEIHSYRATHKIDSDPVIYAIKEDSKTILYCHDSGILSNEALLKIKELGYINLLSLDCTGCLGKSREWIDNHMSLETNLILINKLKELNVINDKTILVANHFSHNGGEIYDEMVEVAKKYNIIVAYDGLEITI